jgi:5-oxoprolinase (ATP-hydrolysing) subunit C
MSALARIRIIRAAPLTTVQDLGRFGALRYGIAASGPMDAIGWAEAGGGSSGIEFTLAGLEFTIADGIAKAGFGGGCFELKINGKSKRWPVQVTLKPGDNVVITPGSAGNYGYVRFGGDLDVPLVIGSRATSTVAALGGFQGRSLRPGDELAILAGDVTRPAKTGQTRMPDAPLRFVWGLHADLFDARERSGFVSSSFFVSHRLDRMGVRLEDRAGVFASAQHLSLVSDSVVPGDVQVLGDGTPIVLMRDHQPTGGYPRIATLLSAEISRFAQMRPGEQVRFEPVSLERATAERRRSGRS